MDLDNDNWAAVHQQLLEEPGIAAIPSHLQNYSPDVHGTLFENPGRWLAEFGCSEPYSIGATGVPGVQGNGFDGRGSSGVAAAGAGKVSSEPGLPGAAPSEHAPGSQQQDVWGLPGQTGPLLGQLQQQQLQQQLQMGSSHMQQQQQHGIGMPGSTQQGVASSPQQQQQQANQQQQQAQLQIAQLQGIQLLQQQQQQQPVLSSAHQQQLWGLQQQLWTLQQQAALISQQQQQLGMPLAVVMQQQPQQQAGQPTSLPMQLAIPLNVSAGLQGASAASFTSPGTDRKSVV